MKKSFRIIIVLAAILLAVIVPSPALAMAEPDAVTLYDIEIFKDLLVTGDAMATVPYQVYFTSLPTDDINLTYIFSIWSPDGSTEVATILAYARYTGGYGNGMVTFYIESGFTWGAAYIFRVQQNPVYYPAPRKWDFTIGTNEYSTDADQSQGLRAKVIDSADELSTKWSVDLLTSADSGQTVLSTLGELYYLNAIPGLQTMCPELFSVQIEVPDYSKRAWSYSFAESLRTKYSGTIIADFMTGFAGLFNMAESSAMNVLSIIMFAIVIAVSVAKFKGSTLSAFIDGYDVLLLLTLEGFCSMILTGIFAFFAVVLGGIILFLNR